MDKPLFSIALIMKNEEKSLPRLFESLKSFLERGGEAIALDTGSLDSSIALGRSLGACVLEAEDTFLREITLLEAKEANEMFVLGGEEEILKDGGDKVFDFAAARNTLSELAVNDFVIQVDADEVITQMDIAAINALILSGCEQMKYQFVEAHDSLGAPAVQFIQSKAGDRRKTEWVGVLHEMLERRNGEEIREVIVPPSIYRLEHWQNPDTNRSGYLKGLALDCLERKEYARGRFLLGRELLRSGRPKSAISALTGYMAMENDVKERAESEILMGDAYLTLGKEREAIAAYGMGFFANTESNRALIKLARLAESKGHALGAASYAAAACEIPWNGRYEGDLPNYREVPHEILYTAKALLGDKEGAKKHLSICLAWRGESQRYLEDMKNLA